MLTANNILAFSARFNHTLIHSPCEPTIKCKRVFVIWVWMSTYGRAVRSLLIESVILYHIQTKRIIAEGIVGEMEADWVCLRSSHPDPHLWRTKAWQWWADRGQGRALTYGNDSGLLCAPGQDWRGKGASQTLALCVWRSYRDRGCQEMRCN